MRPEKNRILSAIAAAATCSLAAAPAAAFDLTGGYYMTYGEPGRDTAKSILSSARLLLDEGCVAQMPEVLDGDWPHVQRGCDAQAWGISELYRVWRLLGK